MKGVLNLGNGSFSRFVQSQVLCLHERSYNRHTHSDGVLAVSSLTARNVLLPHFTLRTAVTQVPSDVLLGCGYCNNVYGQVQVLVLGGCA